MASALIRLSIARMWVITANIRHYLSQPASKHNLILMHGFLPLFIAPPRCRGFYSHFVPSYFIEVGITVSEFCVYFYSLI